MIPPLEALTEKDPVLLALEDVLSTHRLTRLCSQLADLGVIRANEREKAAYFMLQHAMEHGAEWRSAMRETLRSLASG